MAKKIPKHITDKNEWEVEDFISYARTGECPVSPAWTKARGEALADAGLGDDAAPVAAEDQSVAEIAKRMQSTKTKLAD